MNKQQRDAIAMTTLASVCNVDTYDLKGSLPEWNTRGGIDVEMTEDDLEAIIVQVQDMHAAMLTKAHNKFQLAFKGSRRKTTTRK